MQVKIKEKGKTFYLIQVPGRHATLAHHNRIDF